MKAFCFESSFQPTTQPPRLEATSFICSIEVLTSLTSALMSIVLVITCRSEARLAIELESGRKFEFTDTGVFSFKFLVSILGARSVEVSYFHFLWRIS